MYRILRLHKGTFEVQVLLIRFILININKGDMYCLDTDLSYSIIYKIIFPYHRQYMYNISSYKYVTKHFFLIFRILFPYIIQP